MSLQEKIDALVSAQNTEADPGRSELKSAIASLVADEERSRPLKAGDDAPHFRLPSYGDAIVALEDGLKSGPLVVTFYRGLWCPYCQQDLRSFASLLTETDDLGWSVMAISQPRSPGTDRPTDHDLGLNFPVLEDTTGDAAVEYGIRWSEGDTRLIERILGLDLLSFRGTAPWINPMQARFVIDRKGRIAFSEVAFDYDERTEPADLMPLLTRLRDESD